MATSYAMSVGAPAQGKLSTGSEFARGWLVLSATFISIGCGVSLLSFYTTGVFMVTFQEQFGWSRSAIPSVTVVELSI